MDKQKKKKVLVSVIVVCAVILLCATGYILIKSLGIFSAGNTNKKVQESFAPDLTAGMTAPDGHPLVMPSIQPQTGATGTTGATVPPTTTSGGATTIITTTNNPVDFEGLMAYNPDVYAWIYIPDTNISLPVLQSPQDDNFYLDHDVYKDYSFPGAIYSQSKNNREFTDRVTVLYGHNMNDGSMFADLHMFGDEDFFHSHPYFYVFTKDRRLTYEVVSAHDYDDRHILNSYNFTDDKVFQEWLTNAKEPRSLYSNVRDSVKLDLNSKMLVLSTCTGSGDGRYLVQGVLIGDEKTK